MPCRNCQGEKISLKDIMGLAQSQEQRELRAQQIAQQERNAANRYIRHTRENVTLFNKTAARLPPVQRQSRARAYEKIKAALATLNAEKPHRSSMEQSQYLKRIVNDAWASERKFLEERKKTDRMKLPRR